MRPDTVNILGVEVHRKPLDVEMGEIAGVIEKRTGKIVFACANPHSIVEAQKDKEFMSALNHADYVVADGVGVTVIGTGLG